MHPEAEKLLRQVLLKSIGKDKVDGFLDSVGFIRQHGDSSDIAVAVMAVDSIEQNIAVMQDYLDDEESIEIYDDMPVGNVLQAVMNVLEMDTLLRAVEVQKLAEIKEDLMKVITVLHIAKNNC